MMFVRFSMTFVAPNEGTSQNPFLCGAEAAQSVSVAALLHNIPGLNSGAGGFVADAVGSNVASAATDLAHSFFSGESGGHSVFYNMGQGIVAGPTQGFSPVFAKAFGESFEESPFSASLLDAGTVALLGAEYASGIGEAKLIYDGITYAGATLACRAGLIK